MLVLDVQEAVEEEVGDIMDLDELRNQILDKATWNQGGLTAMPVNLPAQNILKQQRFTLIARNSAC